MAANRSLPLVADAGDGLQLSAVSVKFTGGVQVMSVVIEASIVAGFEADVCAFNHGTRAL